jgi:peptide deformylase
MALLTIRTYPDPVLREVASPVRHITEKIRTLSSDMLETMKLSNGAGLAANQVGVPIRLIVIDAHLNQDNRPLILINPEIIEMESEIIAEEGCLSVPHYYEFIKRAKRVFVRAMDMDQKTVEINCEGPLAKAFQHEIDHLNGILFIDHLSPVKKGIFKKQYNKIKK